MARSPQRRDEQSGFDFQFLSLSNAIAIQVTLFFVVVGVIIVVFWYRRRTHRQRKAADDSEAAGPVPDAKDKPYIGYRASILKITPAYRKGPRDQDDLPVRDESRRRRDDDRWRKEESRRRPRDDDRRKMDDERRRHRQDDDRRMRSKERRASPHARELVETAPAPTYSTTIPLAVELPGESAPRPGIGLAITGNTTFEELARKNNSSSSDAASVSTLRIHNWLPELPAPALSRSPTPDMQVPSRATVASKSSTAGQELVDLHDHLTKDFLVPAPSSPDSPTAVGGGRHSRAQGGQAAVDVDSSRWSATTRSSTFTALSSRSSSAAYVSTLRPPPLFRQTQLLTMEPLPESRPAVAEMDATARAS